MNRRRTALAAAALVVAAGPALAATPAAHNFSSQVSVTGMRYELIDLRPDDGIAPAVQFTPFEFSGAASVELLSRGKFTGDNHFSTDQLGASFASVLLASGSGAAAVMFDGAGPRLMAMGTGSTVGDKRTGARTAFESRAEAAGYGLKVLLSPGTEMRWTGSFVTEAFADRWWGVRAAQAAGASLQVFHGDAGDSTPTFQSFGAVAFANPQLGAQHGREAGTFTFSHVNDGTEWKGFNSGVIAGAMGGYRPTSIGAVAPVPEPSTYALFAAGLGVVGVVARRRAGPPA